MALDTEFCYAECHTLYAACHYAERRYNECYGPFVMMPKAALASGVNAAVMFSFHRLFQISFPNVNKL